MTPPTDGTAGALEHGARWLEIVLASALLAAVAMNFTNVVARYVFDHAMQSVDELQVYLMVALAFFGSVVATVRNQHLRMDVLTRYYPLAMQRLLNGLEAVGGVALCGFVCWVSTNYAIRMHQIGSTSENAHIPLWIPHGLVGLAFACMTVVSIVRLLHPRGAPPPDELGVVDYDAEAAR